MSYKNLKNFIKYLNEKFLVKNIIENRVSRRWTIYDGIE